jgi:hypothetical protein
VPQLLPRKPPLHLHLHLLLLLLLLVDLWIRRTMLLRWHAFKWLAVLLLWHNMYLRSKRLQVGGAQVQSGAQICSQHNAVSSTPGCTTLAEARHYQKDSQMHANMGRCPGQGR